MDIRATLAKNLRLARTQQNISQEELAERACLDRTYVSGIERAVRNPTIEVVEKLAAALALQAVDLLKR